MNIIALLIFGFLLLGFVLFFRKRNNKDVEMLLKQNRNVQPLFKEASAKNKYQSLSAQLNNNPEAQNTLLKLHQDFTAHLISVDDYNTALDELSEQYLKD